VAWKSIKARLINIDGENLLHAVNEKGVRKVTQKRLQSERKKAAVFRKAQSAKGKASAAVKSQKTNETHSTAVEERLGERLHSGCNRPSTDTPTENQPSTTLSKKESKKEEEVSQEGYVRLSEKSNSSQIPTAAEAEAQPPPIPDELRREPSHPTLAERLAGNERGPPAEAEHDGTMSVAERITERAEEAKLARAAVDAWNELAEDCGLPRVQRLTEPRRKSVLKRLPECGGIEGWHAVLAKIRDGPHLLGQTTNWRCTFDWLCKPANFTKVAEGNYDKPHHPKPNGPAEERKATIAAILGK
jgi:hypothetical protein